MKLKRIATDEKVNKIVVDYKKDLVAMRELEDKVKEDSQKLMALRKETPYLELKKSLEKNASQLTQAQIGDDVLMLAWSWPRLLPSGIPQEEKCHRFTENSPFQDWKHSDIENYKKEIKQLQIDQKEYSESKKSDRDYIKNLEAFDTQIDALKDKIKSTEKFPNILYEVLRPAIEQELTTEAAITNTEEDILYKLEPLLKDLQPKRYGYH